MIETWRPCFGDRYEVSDLGRVRRNGRILKQRITMWSPYPCISLKKNGVGHTFFVHALVAEAFIGPRPKCFQVNHKNFDKADNRATNIEYVTPKENIRHCARAGRHNTPRGERSGHAKIAADDVREIRLLRAAGSSLAELSAQFGISEPTVCSIARRKHWRSVA